MIEIRSVELGPGKSLCENRACPDLNAITSKVQTLRLGVLFIKVALCDNCQVSLEAQIAAQNEA